MYPTTSPPSSKPSYESGVGTGAALAAQNDASPMSRWAWVEVDPAAITHNTRVIAEVVAPANVWAVVKADGYGHGSVVAARAALDGGATGLCVALIDEGVVLRDAGIMAPILVLSEQPDEAVAFAVRRDLRLTVYSRRAIEALQAVGAVNHPVHLKVDTGMRRVGCPPDQAVELAQAIDASPATTLDGVFTHLAVADEPDDPFTAIQLARFDDVLTDLRLAGLNPPHVHAANSAGALAHPRARYSMVRSGIALYGLSPAHGIDRFAGELHPALSVHAKVTLVKRVAAGEGISYGLRHTFAGDATVATVALGYADGVPRRLSVAGGEVLIGCRRRPIVGVVTMDQLMVDCGDDDVAVGDPVVLIGAQGDEVITAVEWADRLGTIGYEIVCGLAARLERRASTG